MKNVLYYLLLGTRGGESRSKILLRLKDKPSNAHILSKELNYDYKTIKHHLRVLIKHKIIEKKGTYGGVYFLSRFLDENFSEFDEIWKQLGYNSGKSI